MMMYVCFSIGHAWRRHLAEEPSERPEAGEKRDRDSFPWPAFLLCPAISPVCVAPIDELIIGFDSSSVVVVVA